MLLSVAPAAFAQVPPPHVHNWVVDTAPNTYVVLGSNYVRCGEVISVGAGANLGTADHDVCTVTGFPPCPLNNEDTNACTVTGWRDNNGGGQFGYLDGSGDFVASSDPDVITHYKAPDTPGNVTIQSQLDDTLENGTSGSNADDDPAWSTATVGGTCSNILTVYEFDITDTPSNWEPKGNSEANSTTYTARIRPSTDYQGNSMARQITFSLSSSSEPGYCINAGTQTDRDLKLLAQSGFNVTSDTQAITTSAQTQATLTVNCYDYGAYGTINAQISNPAGAGGYVSARLRRDTTIYPKVTGALIPYDYDQYDLSQGPPGTTNKIWDSWQSGVGATISATADADDTPTGNGTDGDGFSAYEEYRGFMISVQYTRTSPSTKDMFVVPYESVGNFPDGLGLTLHQILSFQQSSRVVNFNGNWAHIGDMYCALTEDASLPFFLGQTLGRIDTNHATCLIDTDKLTDLAELGPHTFSEWIDAVVTHELGHSVMQCSNADHHDPETSACVMTLTCENAWPTLPSTFCAAHQAAWWLSPN